jgi:hypothetical protein
MDLPEKFKIFMLKKSLFSVAFLLLLFSCMESDDAIPDGLTLERPTLYGNVEGPQSVKLNWSSAQICNGFCPQFAKASLYEIYQKLEGSNQPEIRIGRLTSETTSFLVSNLQPNVNYIFRVKASRAGISNYTNSIMISPHNERVGQVIVEIEKPAGIRKPSLSPDGRFLAYCDNFQWVDDQERSALSLFIRDLSSSETQMIQKNAFLSSWSSDGNSLLFTVDEDVPLKVQGYRPQHLGIYEIDSKTIKRVYKGDYFANFPVFGKDDKEILFTLDSTDMRKESVMRVNPVDNQISFIANLPIIESWGQTSTSGASFWKETNTYAIATREEKENDFRSAFDIHGYRIPDGQKSILEESEWNDQIPSISPNSPFLMAFLSDRSGYYQVWVKNLQTGKLIQLTDFTSTKYLSPIDLSFSWADQGKSLVFNAIDINTSSTSLFKYPIPNF